LSQAKISTAQYESKPEAKVLGNINDTGFIRSDPKETNGAIWYKPELPGQSVLVPVEPTTTSKLSDQGFQVEPVKSTVASTEVSGQDFQLLPVKSTEASTELSGQGVHVTPVTSTPVSAELSGQGVQIPPARSTAELQANSIPQAPTYELPSSMMVPSPPPAFSTTAAEAPTNPLFSLGQPTSTSEGEGVFSTESQSPPLAITELAGGPSANRLENLRVEQARLQERRARLVELQRIDEEEARLKQERELLNERDR
jgi:hypothetical protein